MIEETTTTSTMTINFRPRVWNPRYESYRSHTAKPRVYVDAGDFNLLEDLENRFRRPHKVYRSFVLKALELLGLDEPKIGWSQKAGCSCGCSPGFIVQNVDRALNGAYNWDVWVTINGAPKVDETKPARSLVPALV